MKISKSSLLTLMLSVMMVLLPVFTGCTGAVKTEDIQGLLQAVDNKELVLTLDDGTTTRIKVEDAKTISGAQELIGRRVVVKARSGSWDRVEIQPLGENAHLTGIIESITSDAVVIGGRILKVTPGTMLDGGLAPGVLSRAEFIKASDGSLIATGIETAQESIKLTGAIASVDAGTIVIGGKTCKVNSITRLEDGLTPGVQARVRLIATSDGSMVAVAVEREQGDDRFTGKVEAIRPDALVIGGKIVRINSATSFEQGLSEGALVRVRFIVMNDGSLLATRVEVEKRRIELEREQESQSLEEQVRVQEQQLQSRMERVVARDLELRRRQQELEQFEQVFSIGSVDEAKQRADVQQLRRRVAEGEGSQESESGGSSTGDAVSAGGTAAGGGAAGDVVGGTTAGGGTTVGGGIATGGTAVGAGTDAGGATGTDTGGTGGSSGGGGGSDDSGGGSGGGGSDDSGGSSGGGSDDSGGGGGDGGGGGNS